MPRTLKPQPDNPEQFKRFLETAREVEAGPHPERFDRVLEKVARMPKSKPTSGRAKVKKQT